MELSIITVNFNTKDALLQCLASIKRTVSNDVSYEIIVADNGSTDGSVEGVKEQFPDVKVIENKENVGFGKANNQAYEQSSGAYIFLLNPDTELTDTAVAALLAFLKSQNDCALVAPQLQNEDRSTQASCFRLPTLTGAVLEYFFGVKGAYSKYYPKANDPTEVDAVVGAAMLLPRSVVDQLGIFFDETFFLYYEDIDLCRRIKRLGKKIYYLPQARVIHYHGVAAQKTGSWAYEQNKKSAKIYFGLIDYFLVTLVLRFGQKWQKLITLLSSRVDRR